MQKTYSGIVIRGDGKGKTIGYPTANIDISNLEINLKPGVYSAQTKLKNKNNWYQAILFFGPKKTFDKDENNLEIHILNFNNDIYDQTLEFKIGKFIRKPIKFDSVEKLVEQIQEDIKKINY
jgi:riboflavin kinase / FMN adenylyltransferase